MDTIQKTTRVAKKRQSIGGLRGLMLNFNYFDEYDIIDSLGTLCCQSLKILLFFCNMSGFNTHDHRLCF